MVSELDCWMEWIDNQMAEEMYDAPSSDDLEDFIGGDFFFFFALQLTVHTTELKSISFESTSNISVLYQTFYFDFFFNIV